MNKQELVQSIATKLEVSQVEAKNILSTLEETIKEGLKSDGEVVFMDSKFKTAHVEAKEARMATNPKDPQGDKIRVEAKPATTKVVFKVGKKLKELFA